MFVECFINNGKPYLRLVQSVRVTKDDGRKISQKQVIHNLGPLDRYDDGQPDYVARLKKSFKAGDPLIPALLPYCGAERPKEKYRFVINEGSPDLSLIYCKYFDISRRDAGFAQYQIQYHGGFLPRGWMIAKHHIDGRGAHGDQRILKTS